MKLDFGSGFAPIKGWATLDSGANCTFNSINEIPDNTITKIRFRNVLHHIQDLDLLFSEITPKLRSNAKIIVIECREEYYRANLILDLLWYRFIQNRTDIHIAPRYRDYRKTLKNLGFTLQQQTVEDEKEVVIFSR